MVNSEFTKKLLIRKHFSCDLLNAIYRSRKHVRLLITFSDLTQPSIKTRTKMMFLNVAIMPVPEFNIHESGLSVNQRCYELCGLTGMAVARKTQDFVAWLRHWLADTSVTRFSEISPLWHKLNVIGNFLRVYSVFGKNCYWLQEILYTIG